MPNREDPPEDQRVIRTYDVYACRMPTPKGLQMIGIIVDVTEQVQALEAKAALHTQMEALCDALNTNARVAALLW